jgi:hypothetical protein
VSAMKEMYFEANEMFNEWERFEFGDKSHLSDDDRRMWIEGYMFGYASGKKKSTSWEVELFLKREEFFREIYPTLPDHTKKLFEEQ